MKVEEGFPNIFIIELMQVLNILHRQFCNLYIIIYSIRMLGQTKKSATMRKSAKLPKLNIQQQIQNQQIAERMNRKVAFTRNPRHTNQTMSYAEAFTTNTFQNKFRVEPEQLFFSNYDTTHIYESEVKLINNSKHIQRIKVTPLNQKEFVLANIKYPKEDSGDIAPGMAAIVTIRFRPTTLNDYQDELIIIVGEGVLKVPILAQRQKCDISWPKIVQCGHCWVGDVIKKEIVLKNRGGEAQFTIVNTAREDKQFKIGYFKVSPTTITFQKNATQKVLIEFEPEMKGVFKQKIKFKSFQGQQEEIEVAIEGGAYSAQIVLEQLNNETILEQKINNILYLSDTETNKEASSSLKIRNLAVVQVDYFWHFVADNLKINNLKGKMKPSELLLFNISVRPKQKIPQTIKLELYLYNLPEKSLAGNVVSKNINGIDAIQCLNIEIKTKPVLSNLSVTPLHRQIMQPIYDKCSVQQNYSIINNSSVKRTFTIQKIKEDDGLQTTCSQYAGSIEPNSQRSISVNFHLKQLTSKNKIAYFLVSFDNASSQIFSIEGKSTYPELLFKEQVLYYGLCKTFTLNKRKLTLKNPQKSAIQFKFINQNRFYVLQFYDFYQFQDEESYKKRFNIYNPLTGKEVLDWFAIPAESQIQLDCYLNTLQQESINLQIILQVKNGKSTKIPILAEVQDVLIEMSRQHINLKEIYKGNVYNSNKFLSKELQFVNKSNHDCAYIIAPPQSQQCDIKIEPLKGIIPKNSKKRIDVIIEPIKTGNFDIRIKWKYFDDFKVNPDLYLDLIDHIQFNQADGKKAMIKQRQLQLTGLVKGMAMNYYIKDESRAKKVRQKIEDFSQSVKLSSSSFNSSMKSSKGNLLENQKIVYPLLEELNFYNCEINQVKQVQIIIENDSGLTTQYEVFAQLFHTLEKPTSAGGRSHKGLIKIEQQPFNSEMGMTFIKNRVLDKSQKVHLGNNKGISILCQPAAGTLNKKQTQKIMITMFNDTSGRFKDNLLINVKNHEIKKIPIDIHIKGTPVALSRNQLGIDFNQQIPMMNLGTMLHSNGLVKRNIKVVNNGPKQVQLKWLIYPYNKTNPEQDIFNIEFRQGSPGTGNLVDLKWNALKPQIDTTTHFSLEPRQKTIKGREETVFTILIEQFKTVGQFSNLLICQPCLVDGSTKTEMEALAVVVKLQTVEPKLFMDIKHSNHINKLQRFALSHEQYQTNANNFLRNLKLKNVLKTNLTFDINIISKDQKYQSFKLVNTKTNSPATNFIGTLKNVQRSFVLTYDSILETEVELVANPANLNEWPMEQKVRKDGQIIISYSNGSKQTIDLVGWLYRPWVQIQMPNHQYYSNENFQIDFGVVHFKNTKKMSIYLINPSKVDGKWTITYIKYHQSIKYKFQQSLWTPLDYEDQTIQDQKKCWRLSVDSGIVRNKTIPVHYIPSTLALPSQQDRYIETHKPIQVVIMFKPESNVLYKSKFKISVAEGPTFTIVVKGKGSFDEQLEKK